MNRNSFTKSDRKAPQTVMAKLAIEKNSIALVKGAIFHETKYEMQEDSTQRNKIAEHTKHFANMKVN